MLPSELQSIDSLDTLEQVQGVHKEAQKRAEYAHEHERTIPGTKGKKTYREVYAKIARCANDFQIVGNILSQAEPVYAALPWALIQFGLQCAVGEDEAYQTMLSGKCFQVFRFGSYVFRAVLALFEVAPVWMPCCVRLSRAACIFCVLLLIQLEDTFHYSPHPRPII